MPETTKRFLAFQPTDDQARPIAGHPLLLGWVQFGDDTPELRKTLDEAGWTYWVDGVVPKDHPIYTAWKTLSERQAVTGPEIPETTRLNLPTKDNTTECPPDFLQLMNENMKDLLA